MLLNRLRRAALFGAVLSLSLAGVGAGVGVAQAATGTASAASDPNDLPLSEVSFAGFHNAQNPAMDTYLAQTLDTGAGMIELDVDADPFTQEWKVGDVFPTSNTNNCVDATTPADLYTGSTNKDFASCLDDIRIWLSVHPGAGPIIIKIDNKLGFLTALGMGPTQFDQVVTAHLGSDLYKPADLLGSYPTLDAAAQANAWPTRASLAGKVLLYEIPGTVELDDPFDHTHSDVEYATYLKNLYNAGNIQQATMFPSVLGATSGDPRTQYSDTTIRPWFVFFDGDAATYANGIDTSWYSTNHYILTMTDAQNVPPVLSDTTPTLADAQARFALLAADHASIVSSDWFTLPAEDSEVVPRG